MPFSEKTVDHKDYGKISIVKSTRSGRISISMKPFEPIRLTIPIFVSYKRAEEFLVQKDKWISKNLEKIRKLEGQYTVFTEESEFMTHEHTLEISREKLENPSLELLRCWDGGIENIMNQIPGEEHGRGKEADSW